ncbi:hypothetical protein ACWEFL_10025 [Streptomyces sp. NPDC004838]
MVRTRRLRGGPVVLLVAALAVTAELVAFVVPAPSRPGAGVATAAVVALGCLVWAFLVLEGRFKARHGRVVVRDPGGEWFSRRGLEGFPASGIRRTAGGDGGNPVRVEEAWVLARHGYGVAWLTSRLGVPHEVAEVLVRAARERAPGPGSPGAEADGLDEQQQGAEEQIAAQEDHPGSPSR